MNAKEFLKTLRKEVESHPGVAHPFLSRAAQVPFTREDYRVIGLQHYPLVGRFTTYLEHLLLSAPDSDSKSWIAKVLVDEYGEGSEGKDHAELYREYLQSCGASNEEIFITPLHPAVTHFVKEHLRIVREEPFLVGLGALGPGHEWAIPKMFPMIVKGLRNAGFQEKEILYFALHMEQDIDHGLWLEEALERFAVQKTAQKEIRKGALLSLEARRQFWDGVQSKVVQWRQPLSFHLRPNSILRRRKSSGPKEINLYDLQASV